MKKILSVVLAVVMLMSMACVAFAASNHKVTAVADKTSVEKGEVVTITVAIPSNTDLCVLSYTVKYDANNFTYVDESFVMGNAFSLQEKGIKDYGIAYAGIVSGTVTEAKTVFTFQVVAENSGKIEFIITEAYVGENGNDALDSFQANSTKEIYIEVKGNEAPVDPPVTPEEPEDPPVTPEEPEYSAKILAPSKTKIRNKDGIILHPEVEAPAGTKYVWSWNNKNFKVTTNSNGTVRIIAEDAGNTTFTLSLVDENNNVLATDSISMYSDSGFFQKIGGFFRSLFGATKVDAR